MTAQGRIVVALGTRPEIIKLAPIIKLLGRRARVVHTGQHYDAGLSNVFFSAFDLPEPDVQLEIGGTTRASQIGETTQRVGEHLLSDPADAMVVQGDTNTTLGAALAASANETPVIHIEAGLRSFDRAMPEEHNRVLTDMLSDLCCAPTKVSEQNLLDSAVPASRIVVTGNTIVEALQALLPADRAGLLEAHDLTAGQFVLATFHRPENVDDPENLAAILEQLANIPLPVVLPMHPRTEERIAGFGLSELLTGIQTVKPVGYEEFLGLSAECSFLISDSGGVQEEASILKRPVLVVRRSTERPEVLGTFAERVLPGPEIGRVARGWIDDLSALHRKLADLPSPYGDGTAAEKSVAAIERLLEGG